MLASFVSRLLIVGLMAVSALSMAEPARTLHVGFQNQHPPHAYMEAGQAKGIEVELVKEAVIRAGFDPKIHIIKLQRVLNKLQQGDLDIGSLMLLPTSPFGRDAKNVIMVDRPHVSLKIYFYAKDKKMVALKSVPEMLKYRVGQHQAAMFYNHPDFPNRRPIQFFRNYKIMLSALARNRVDLAVADEVSVAYLSQNDEGLARENIKAIYLIDMGEFYLTASEKALGEEAQAIVEKIDDSLQEVMYDGTLLRILKSYDLEHMADRYLGN